MRALAALLLAPGLALAQGTGLETQPLAPPPEAEQEDGAAPAAPEGYVEEIIEVEKPVSRSTPQPVAVIRGLDKISGRVTDITLEVGRPAEYGRLTILAEACRRPPADEAPDAFVFLKVWDAKVTEGPVFSGWMFASSPALSAMDHQRYDLWALRCEAG